MTRRLIDRPPRRLLRMRSLPHRPGHGFDVALARPEPAGDPARPADARVVRALAEENALLLRELGRVQARCTRWRDDCLAQADRLEVQLRVGRDS